MNNKLFLKREIYTVTKTIFIINITIETNSKLFILDLNKATTNTSNNKTSQTNTIIISTPSIIKFLKIYMEM